MFSSNQILTTARERGIHEKLPYAGAVTPAEAHRLVGERAARLVDVRTDAERDWVGQAAIPDDLHAAVQWSTYPGGVVNADFIAQLGAAANKEDVLLFMCRSGVRSRHAAKLATEHGYQNCFDILEGFEGDKNGDGHRKTVTGWCKAGLPWIGA
ncbi:MAG: rhodanese-like domain-containing protein [Herminiimonas sp.]|nr:rhodanese-like domain-containing protein [Herminiimonas sp.]